MKGFSTKDIGNLGEDIASKFLKKQKFSIIERNYWQKWGEIDIVAQKDNILRFVEVKTVSVESVAGENLDKYRPEDNVHPRKIQRLNRAIETFLAERKFDKDWQIDVITVKLDIQNKKAKIDFLENVILN